MQASDNTRHKSVNPSTGEAFLLPAHGIRRVVLCTGQIYYHMSMARRTRRIRDIVLVRLEQIAPFPSDLLIKASLLCQTSAWEHSPLSSYNQVCSVVYGADLPAHVQGPQSPVHLGHCAVLLERVPSISSDLLTKTWSLLTFCKHGLVLLCTVVSSGRPSPENCSLLP